MIKLKQSAFALSLMALCSLAYSQTRDQVDFLGLETEITPKLSGDQKFGPRDMFDKSDWNTDAHKIELDKDPLKGQKYSLIPWSTLEPEEWLGINQWLIERSVKDKSADWQMRLRDQMHHELIGKVLKCFGICKIYRGTNAANGQYLSRVLEGDEIVTEKDSSAWVYLMDGTLLRISSGSSVSLLEVNLGKKEVFFLLRLNQGHIYVHPRSKMKLALDEAPETDAASLPLMIREANQESFERAIYQKQKDKDQLLELVTMDDQAIKNQFDKINEMRESSGEITQKTKLMVVAPNATLISCGISFDFLFVPGGKSYFKPRSDNDNQELSLYLRGYSNVDVQKITSKSWYEVSQDGRNFISLDSPSGDLQVTELITKRIKSLELAREIWFKNFSLPVFESISNLKKLAVDHGYNLWGEESTKRVEFLLEYTRRIETTHLRSIDNLLERLEVNGDKANREISNSHYQASLNYYLKGLKKRYTDKEMQIRETNDLQYYVWILRNGKK